MKRSFILISTAIFGIVALASCDKEQPAENVQGNYTGVLDAVYDGDDTLNGSYPVFVTATTKNKVLIEGSLFSSFEVLVTQQGVNVDPVSTDENVAAFLYQGDVNNGQKELSFTYYNNGDTAIYVGTKP
jgi:hypothetical protein